MNQERCEPALRRDTDVKWISRNRTGECDGSWIDITLPSPASVWPRGIDISFARFIDFFLCMLLPLSTVRRPSSRDWCIWIYALSLLTICLYHRGSHHPYHISSQSSVAGNRWHNERWPMI